MGDMSKAYEGTPAIARRNLFDRIRTWINRGKDQKDMESEKTNE